MESGPTFAQPQSVQFIGNPYSASNMEQYYQGSIGAPTNYLPADSFGAGAQFYTAPHPDAHMKNDTSGYNTVGTLYASSQGYAGVPNGMGPGPADSDAAFYNALMGYQAAEHQAAMNGNGQDLSEPDDPEVRAAFMKRWKANSTALWSYGKSRGQPSRRSPGSQSFGVDVTVAHLQANTRAFTDMPRGMGPVPQADTNFMGQGLNNTPGQVSTGMPNYTAAGQQADYSRIGHAVNPQPSPPRGLKNYTPANYNRAPPRQQNSPSRKRSASFEIVTEDPSLPRQKRARLSEEDEQRQREEQRLMREAGGSCLWCYRNKKKCGPRIPCSNCESNGFQCIRDPLQLCLSLSTSNSTGSSTGNTAGSQVIDVFHHLRDVAMQSTPHAHVNVNFRQPATGAMGFWTASLPQAEPYSPGYVNEQVVSTLLGFVQSPGLDCIENETARHPLVLLATSMLRVLAVIKCLLSGRVYVRPTEADAGRITVFYMLTACIQSLRERSEAFSSKLCEAVRRKSDGRKTSPSARKPLNPQWAATGLYYQVIEGVQSMELTPLLEKALGDVSPPHDLPSNVRSVLRWLPQFGTKLNSNIEADEALRDHIPVMEEQRPLDIALLPGVDGEQLPPTVMQRLAEPFSGPSYKMETFLGDSFGFLGNISTSTAAAAAAASSNINQAGETDVDWDALVDFEVSESSGLSAPQSYGPSTESFVGSEGGVMLADDGFLEALINMDEHGDSAAFPL